MNWHSRVEGPILAGVEAASAFFRHQFDAGRETLCVAHVDDEVRCIHLMQVPGGPWQAALPIRQIIADALRLDTCGIILAHNHPSGDPAPSPTDRDSTRRLVQAAEAIDLTVLDHLVFAGSEVRSFRRMGLL